MLSSGTFEGHVARLVDPATEPSARLQLITEVRDSIEIVQTAEYPAFLRFFFPAFQRVLESLTVPQEFETTDQKIRNVVLEVLNRLPHNEVLKPHIEPLMTLALKILATDNEDNAIIAQRIIFDLHKNFRPSLESSVQKFLNFVLQRYATFKAVVALTFTPDNRSVEDPTSRLAQRPQSVTTAGQAAAAAQAAQAAAAAAAVAAAANAPGGTASPAAVAAATAAAAKAAAAAGMPIQGATIPAAGTAAASAAAAVASANAAANAAAAAAAAAASSSTSSAAASNATTNSPVRLTKSAHSFKVVTECPLTVMFLFQLYPRHAAATIDKLLPLMVHAIEVQFPDQNAMVSAAGRPKNKGSYHDLIAAQVKTVSFLGYLLKTYQQAMEPYAKAIPRSVVQLLLSCPGDTVGIRKELLIATRHILATDFRNGFYDQIDLLLDEKVLVGTGRSAYDTLRPLAYSFLAELVHYVRLRLTLPQLSRIIYLFSANVHDPNLSYAVQTTSVRLLYNLIEGILNKNDPEGRSRQLLIRIMDTIVNKYVTVMHQVPRLLKVIKESASRAKKDCQPSTSELGSARPLTEEPLVDSMKEVADCKILIKTLTMGLNTVVWSASNLRVPMSQHSGTGQASVTTQQQQQARVLQQQSAAQAQAHALLQQQQTQQQQGHAQQLGQAQTLPQQQGQRPTPQSTHQGASTAQGQPQQTAPRLSRKGLQEEECLMLGQLLACAPVCFRLYEPVESVSPESEKFPPPAKAESLPPVSSPGGNSSATKTDETEIMDQLARIFVVLEPKNFQDVFGSRLQSLFDLIVANPAYLTIPQQFLRHKDVSKYFADILVTFLVERMSLLDITPKSTVREKAMSQTVLRLFRILFYSVNSFPGNEPVLRPHLQSIVQGCLKNAAQAEDPDLYYQLLKALFKSMKAGKFELLHKDFLPLVQPVLEGLTTLEAGANPIDHTEEIIDLCLTIPARPSAILPYLGLHIRPIVQALSLNNSELLAGGLRQLEFWVDSLQLDFLEPVLDLVEPDLSFLLTKHLKSGTHGPLALKILGKLGAKTRRHLKTQPALRFRDDPEEMRLSVDLSFVGGSPFKLPLPDLVKFAARSLLPDIAVEVVDADDNVDPKTSEQFQIHSYRFLQACLALFILESSSLKPGCRSKLKFPSQRATSPEGMETSSPQLPGVEQRRDSQLKITSRVTLGLVLQALIVGLSKGTAENMEEANNFRTSMFAYFAVIMNESALPVAGDTSLAIDSGIVVDAIVDTMTSTSPVVRKAGNFALQEVLRVITEPFRTQGGEEEKDKATSKASSDDNPLDSAVSWGQNVGKLAERFCHCCYQRTWRQKAAGVHGIRILARSLPRTAFVSRSGCYEPYLMKSLLFVMRDIPQGMAGTTTQAASDTLEEVLRATHGNDKSRDASMVGEEVENYDQLLEDMALWFSFDILSESETSRTAAQKAVRTLSEMTGRTELQLITPAKENIMKPILQRPLRTLPYPVQIGHISALSFCLEVKPPLIGSEILTSAPLKSLLLACIETCEDSAIQRLVEAEDSTINKLAEKNFVDPKIIRHLVALRRSAAYLLYIVTRQIPKLSEEGAFKEISDKITSLFFRSLESKNAGIVDVAKKGLALVVARPDFPKELLQNNLRPILTNLSDYRKLSVPYLNGLSRVLELLSTWFNVSLGEKLLDHLRRWLEPEKIAESKIWPAGTESRVAESLLNLFHLLPDAASKFLEPLIGMVIRLEVHLGVAAPGTSHLGLRGRRSASTSPYRKSLLNFCNRHAGDAVSFFLKRLSVAQYRNMFLTLIQADGAERLRQELMDSPRRVIDASFRTGDAGQAPLSPFHNFYGISIVHALSSMDPDWLKQKPEMFRALVDIWRSPERQERLRREEAMPLEHLRESRLLAECMICYYRSHHEEVKTLFEMLSIFSLRTLNDFTFVKVFYEKEITETYSIPEKQKVLEAFLDYFGTVSIPAEQKMYALQYCVLPLLRHSLPLTSTEAKLESGRAVSADQNALVSEVMITQIVRDLLDRPDEALRTFDEPLSAELLQLATVLIQHLPGELIKHRKELIKFGWNHLKREDSMAKYHAFVNVSRFFEAYLAPDKIILQVYVALLRACQNEGKTLVRSALDILTPALPKRLPHNPTEHKYPIWIRYTKKILVEEGHSLPHLVHIWQLIVRHRDLFFPARAQFVPQMVNGLQRIGLASNSATENRRLAIDLADLVIKWDFQRSRMTDGQTEVADESTDTTGKPPVSTGSSRKRDREQAEQDDEGAANNPVKTRRSTAGEPLSAVSRRVDTNRNFPGGQPSAEQRADQAADQENVRSSPLSGDDDFRPSKALCEIVVSFLARVAFASSDTRERRLIAFQCKDLMEQALTLWPSVHVRLTHLEKVLDLNAAEPKRPNPGTVTPVGGAAGGGQTAAVAGGGTSASNRSPEAHLTGNSTATVTKQAEAERARLDTLSQERRTSRASILEMALELTLIVVQRKQLDFLADGNAGTVSALVDPALDSPATRNVYLLAKILRNLAVLLKAKKDRTPVSENNSESTGLRDDPLETIFASLAKVIDANLRSNEKRKVVNTLRLLKELDAVDESHAIRHRDTMLKFVLLRLVKEAIGHPPETGNQAPWTSTDSEEDRQRTPESFLGHPLCICLALVQKWIFELGEHRKHFLQIFWNLIDKCSDAIVLLQVITMMEEWTLKTKPEDTEKSGVPDPLTIKEQMQFLLKMLVFEKLQIPGADSVTRGYLELLLKIFGRDNSEMLTKLERAFMVGLRCPYPEIRAQYFALLEGKLGCNPEERLVHILSVQDWEPLRESDWIRQATELLVATISTEEHLNLSKPLTVRVPELEALDEDQPEPVGFHAHVSSWFNTLSKFRGTKYLLDSLRLLIHCDTKITCYLWTAMQPPAWKTLSSGSVGRVLGESLNGLLVKEYNATPRAAPTIEGLLQGVLATHRAAESMEITREWIPQLPPPMLLHLAKGWNTWHLVIELLNMQLDYTVTAEHEQREYHTVLSEIYRTLNEKDMQVGLWQEHSKLPRTIRALVLEQRGKYQFAQDIYFDLIVGSQSTKKEDLREEETCLWEERWIHCAKQLSQWEILSEFARSVVYSELLHDTLWRLPEWSALKELIAKHPIEDGPQLRLYQSYIHLQEMKVDNCETLNKQAVDRALDLWNHLPVAVSYNAAAPVLVTFQQIVEMQESCKIVTDLASISRAQANSAGGYEKEVESIRQILNNWHERPANEWDEPLYWGKIMRWRTHMSTVLVNSLQNCKEETGREITKSLLVMAVNEAARNVNSFARACRKQGLPDSCIEAVQKIYAFSTMDINEFFCKTKELAKCYLVNTQEIENPLQAGLNQINGCNIESFSNRQKSKLLTLKGNFHRAMSAFEEANQSYSRALAVSGDNASSWLAWGQHCDRVHEENGRDGAWAEAAANCYFMAVRYGSRKARQYLSRVLRLLSIDSYQRRKLQVMSQRESSGEMTDNPTSASKTGSVVSTGKGVVGVFDAFLDLVPSWVWLPWVQQLVWMLSRVEAPRARAILVRLVQHYPQSVFFHIRAFLEERRPYDRGPTRQLTAEALHAPKANVNPFMPSVAAQMSTQNTASQLSSANAQLQKLRNKVIQVTQTHSAAQTALGRLTNAAPNYIQTREQVDASFALLQQTQREVKESEEKVQQLTRRHQAAQTAANQQQRGGSGGDQGNASGGGTTGDSNLDPKSVSSALQAQKILVKSPLEHGDVVMAWLIKANYSVYVELERLAMELSSKMKSQPEEQLLGLMNALLHQCYRLAPQARMEIAPSLRSALEEVSKMCFGTIAPDAAIPTNPARVAPSISDLKEHFEAELAPQTSTDFPTTVEAFVTRLRRWKAIFQKKVDDMSSVQYLEAMSRHLVELRDSEIEMFGQYFELDGEPSPELFVRIGRIRSDVHVVRRHSGASRRLELVGSDGRSYPFVLETSVNAASQRTEERSVQMLRGINRALIKEPQSRVRRLSLVLPVLVPTGQHTRLVSDDSSSLSTSCAIENHMGSFCGGAMDDPLMHFRTMCAEGLSRVAVEAAASPGGASSENAKRKALASRLEAYETVCSGFPDTALAQWMSQLLPNQAELFLARHNFTNSVGVSGIATYMLAIGSRRPQYIFVMRSTGMVGHLYLRPVISRQGVIETEEFVPFRLSRNWQAFIGGRGMNGVLRGAMMASLDALNRDTGALSSFIFAVLRDELSGWSMSRPEGSRSSAISVGQSGRSLGDYESLEERLIKSVDLVLQRIKPLGSEESSKVTEQPDGTADLVEKLISNATSPQALCQMDPSWHAWF